MSLYAARRALILLWCVLALWCGDTVAQQQLPSIPPPGVPPPASSDTASTTGQGAPIKVAVNAVLVPVVVRDAQGRAVGNLQKEDFEVFDQGKQQELSGFSVEKRTSNALEAKPAASTAAAPHVPAATAGPAAAPPTATPAPQRFIVFLFDDLHFSFANLSQVQSAATRMLAGSLGDTDMADVVSFSGANTGMTRDRAKLQEAIMQLKVHNLYQQAGRPCPNIDYYVADLIVNRHNDQAFESAVQDAMTCGNMLPEMRNIAEHLVRSASSTALTIGDQDVRVALNYVKALASKMEALPGERMVILVSPGFMANSAEAQSLKSQIMDVAARSKVTVSALDARGLYATNVDASQRGETSTYALMTGQESQRYSDSMGINESVMAELAEGTGGTFFHNSNDLEGGFKKLTEAPEYVYVLEFSPQNIKANGSYHNLKVKVRPEGLKLQARRGYYAPKADSIKK
jgi:VWFA-related protein